MNFSKSFGGKNAVGGVDDLHAGASFIRCHVPGSEARLLHRDVQQGLVPSMAVEQDETREAGGKEALYQLSRRVEKGPAGQGQAADEGHVMGRGSEPLYREPENVVGVASIEPPPQAVAHKLDGVRAAPPVTHPSGGLRDFDRNSDASADPTR